MAAEKKFEFGNIPIDNSDIFIRNVLKDVTMSMAKLIFLSIQKYFEKSDDIQQQVGSTKQPALNFTCSYKKEIRMYH